MMREIANMTLLVVVDSSTKLTQLLKGFFLELMFFHSVSSSQRHQLHNSMCPACGKMRGNAHFTLMVLCVNLHILFVIVG